MIIFFILATVLLVILAVKDKDFLVHLGWYTVTIFMVLFMTGCATTDTTQPNEPFIYWEYFE